MLGMFRYGLDAHKKIGYDAVDVDFDCIDVMNTMTSDEIAQVKAYADSIAMPIGLTHVPFSEKMATKENVYKALDITKEWGAQCTVIHPPVRPHPVEEYNEQAEYEATMAWLAPFVDYANKIGVTLTVENMICYHKKFPYPIARFCSDPETLCKVADELGIGVCWDTGHANISLLKQSEALAYVGSRLKMVHINDNFALDDVHIPPFIGTIDWEDTMKGLSVTGFDGYFNYEVTTKRLTDEVCYSYGKYLVSAAKKLTSMIK